MARIRRTPLRAGTGGAPRLQAAATADRSREFSDPGPRRPDELTETWWLRRAWAARCRQRPLVLVVVVGLRDRPPAAWTGGEDRQIACVSFRARRALVVRLAAARLRLPAALPRRGCSVHAEGALPAGALHGLSLRCLTFELRRPVRQAALGRQPTMSLRPGCRPRRPASRGRRSSEGLDGSFNERCDRDRPRLGHRLPKGLDALNLVQSLCCEVRGSARWAGPHWDAFNHQEVRCLTVASRHALQMHASSPAGLASRAEQEIDRDDEELALCPTLATTSAA